MCIKHRAWLLRSCRMHWCSPSFALFSFCDFDAVSRSSESAKNAATATVIYRLFHFFNPSTKLGLCLHSRIPFYLWNGTVGTGVVEIWYWRSQHRRQSSFIPGKGCGGIEWMVQWNEGLIAYWSARNLRKNDGEEAHARQIYWSMLRFVRRRFPCHFNAIVGFRGPWKRKIEGILRILGQPCRFGGINPICETMTQWWEPGMNNTSIDTTNKCRGRMPGMKSNVQEKCVWIERFSPIWWLSTFSINN